MTDVARLLANAAFDGRTITEAVDHCVEHDTTRPTRFLIRRAELQDDEKLVREYAGNPEIKEGLWRMHKAGRTNCTCEAIAMHFEEFADLRDVVLKKIEQLL